MNVCSVPDCERPYYAKGCCNLHYLRSRRDGVTKNGRSKEHAPVLQRFVRSLVEAGSDECWPWPSGTKSKTYGRIQEGGRGSKYIGAHRFAYELSKGQIPDGMVVMHSCDNRTCVNPAHLSIGTFGDNTRDAIRKGRFTQSANGAARGEKHGNAKLNSELARRIKASRHSLVDIAALLGLDPSTVRAVRIGETWRDAVPTGDEVEFGLVKIDRRYSSGLHHNCKLSAEQIQQIKASPKYGVALAAEYGVTKQTIYRIRKGS